jgi:hypothetical protein
MSGSRLKKGIIKGITYVLLVNFINLTANFYQVSSLDHTLLKYDDPYDTVAELVLEYFLDMDEETVPDTELPEDKRKMLDIKTLLCEGNFHFLKISLQPNCTVSGYASDRYKNIALGKLSPPPKS